MPRRPLVATIVTTAIGAVMGVVLGALVGRIIAMFGDATIETSVPMIFCGTLGYFVGGTTSAKGSLDRFGSKRSALGAAAAAVILIVLVGGASLARSAGVVVVLAGLVGTVLAAVVATAVGKPNDEPVPTPAVTRKAATPQSPAAEPTPTAPEPAADMVAPRAASAARRVRVEPEPEPLPEPPEDLADDENWRLDESPAPQPAAKKAAVKRTVDPSPAAPARPRRDRPLRKGDS